MASPISNGTLSRSAARCGRPPASGVTPEWAAKWPYEEIWVARRG